MAGADGILTTIADGAERVAPAAAVLALDLDGTWTRLAAWIDQSYTQAPALMLGLAVAVTIPVIAIFGALLRWRRGARETTIALWRRRQEAGTARTDDPGDGLTWPVDAWIETGAEAARLPVHRELMRIGRDEDNDVVLGEPSVHRFHAVIQRSEDAEIVVVDLSGDGGNGVMLNGKRVSRARLRDGDVIGIGEASLKFGSRRV